MPGVVKKLHSGESITIKIINLDRSIVKLMCSCVGEIVNKFSAIQSFLENCRELP